VIQLLDLTLPAPADNLALDEALLLAAETGEGGEVLRFWEWPAPAGVLGASCRLAEDVNEAACLADGVPILRRSSGGGTVLLGAGCLCFSLVLRFDRDFALTQIPTSYVYLLGRTLEALAGIVPGLACAGTSDLAAGGRKFSGNAQQRKRTHLLHHGTLLYGFDLGPVERYLRLPPRQPEYRANRAHGEFLMNLPVGAEELKRRLRAAWGVVTPLAGWPEARVAELVRTKYAQAEWTRRR
jgi:lipoate---protein ligase